MCEGLVAVLSRTADVKVVATAANGTGALEQCRDESPDVVLLDLRLPELTTVEVTEALCQGGDLPRVLVMSSSAASDVVVRAVHAGARGFIPRSAPGSQLLTALRAVHAGRLFLTPDLQTRLLAAKGGSQLSSRELDVLKLVAQGRSNPEIARALNLAAATAKNHVNHVMRKLGADDRTHAVVMAIRRGLLDIG